MTDTLTAEADSTGSQPPSERDRYIDGLRVLASALENNPEIPLPVTGRGASRILIMFHGDDARMTLATAARALPCSWDKRVSGGGESTEFFDLLGTVGALTVELTALREAVCERIVTGTEEREVEEVVTPAVTRVVTKEVETVEWRCGSLLAPRQLAVDAPEAIPADREVAA